MTNQDTPEAGPPWRFLGFSIEKKADVASFVALVLSLIAAGMSLRSYLEGAEANVILPKTITTYSQSRHVGAEDFQAPGPYLEFVYPFLAYNEGAADTTSLIKSMNLVVHYAGQSKQYEPAMFGRIAGNESEAGGCNPADEESLQTASETLCVFGKGDYRPIVVKSDDVVQQDVIFIPNYISDCSGGSACHFENYLWTEDVLATLAPTSGTTPAGITLEVTFDVPNEGICLFGLMWCGRTLKVSCTIPQMDLQKVFPKLQWVSASNCLAL